MTVDMLTSDSLPRPDILPLYSYPKLFQFDRPFFWTLRDDLYRFSIAADGLVQATSLDGGAEGVPPFSDRPHWPSSSELSQCVYATCISFVTNRSPATSARHLMLLPATPRGLLMFFSSGGGMILLTRNRALAWVWARSTRVPWGHPFPQPLASSVWDRCRRWSGMRDGRRESRSRCTPNWLSPAISAPVSACRMR